jgi:hypothetical protein
MASTAAELTWITHLLSDIGLTLHLPPTLLCDNISALHMKALSKDHFHSLRIKLGVLPPPPSSLRGSDKAKELNLDIGLV